MPIMTDRQSVAANAVVPNALSGKLHEFLARPSVVRVYGTASAVGLNVTFLLGGRSIMQDQEVSAQNRMPIVPDDVVAQGMGNAGDRLVLTYRNTTAGAITAFSRVDVEPIA